MKRTVFLALYAACLVGCGPSTRIVSSWLDPNVVIRTDTLHKFIVAALLKNEAARRRTEDKMAGMEPGKAVQSYLVFGNTL